jgi:hypothetical protein
VRLELREQMSALMQEGWVAIDVDREQRRYVFGRSTGRVR